MLVTSLLQGSLILLVFANYIASGLSGGTVDGVSQPQASIVAGAPQRPAVQSAETNATLFAVSKVNENVSDPTSGEESAKIHDKADDARSVELAQPVDQNVEGPGEVESMNPDNPVDGNKTSVAAPKDIPVQKTFSIVAVTNASSSTTTTTVKVNEHKTEEQLVSEAPATEEPNESSSEASNDSAEESESMDAARKEQLAATNPLGPEAENMSSGAMALVMAIVFAVVVVTVYVGLLGWRRYLEYRYGNRELLVNDLEFDTNDLRHFEL